MSVSPLPVRRRLSPEESREAALDAARGLLVELGPQAVTLKAVAARIERTHANLLHHFGSAAGLQKALIERMAGFITTTIREAVLRQRAAAQPDPREVVDLAFDAFDTGGAGALASWMILSGNEDALDPILKAIHDLVEPYASERILLPKEWVGYYEAVQEFVVAADGDRVIGCGALHVLWSDLAEIRTLAVDPSRRRHGVGHALMTALLERARAFGLTRVFCLTFETEFFASHGFRVIEGTPVAQDVYAELLRSHDDGVAEFLDLARVKPNTLGNTRMLRHL